MSGHTPGPWSAKNDGREPIAPGVVILDDDNACGDPECCGPPTYWISIKREDATLIAAAPELLAACRKLVEWHGNRAGFDDDLLPADQQVEWVADAMRAIAKATGEQP